jgi:hypothetical protein
MEFEENNEKLEGKITRNLKEKQMEFFTLGLGLFRVIQNWLQPINWGYNTKISTGLNRENG